MVSAGALTRSALLALVALLTCTSAAHADADSPVAQWHLDDAAGGLTPDSSGSGLNGELKGNAQLVSGGRFGNALSPPPGMAGAFVDVPDSATLEPFSPTLMAWVKHSGTPGNFKWIFAKGASGCSGASYGFTTGAAGGLQMTTYAGSAFLSPDAGPGIWDGQWHAIAGSYDGTLRLYVDGAEVGTGTPTPMGPLYGLQFENTNIGNYPGAAFCGFDYSFPGLIDEVRVYSRALSATEIQYLQNPAHTTPPSLPIKPIDAPPPDPEPPPAPPPAPPPPPGVERNITAPKIDTTVTPKQYHCNPGTWEGVVPGQRFGTTWVQVGLFGKARKVGNGSSYFDLPSADIGSRFYCIVEARGLSGALLRAVSPTVVLSGHTEVQPRTIGRAYGNVRVRGIDLFQTVQGNSGAQTWGFPTGGFDPLCGGGTPSSFRMFAGDCVLSDRDPAHTFYLGVPLDARKPTSALVYVDMENSAATDKTQSVEVTLSARVGGSLQGDGITKKLKDPPVTTTRWVTAAERANPHSWVRFAVPAAWMQAAAEHGQSLDLEAWARLPVGAGYGSLAECPEILVVANSSSCSDDNHFKLDRAVVRDDLPALTIKTIPLLQEPTQRGQPGQQVSDLKPPGKVLEKIARLVPGGERLSILPYSAAVQIIPEYLQLGDDGCMDATDLRVCRMNVVDLALDAWYREDKQSRGTYNILMAVHHYDGGGGALEPGWTRDGTTILESPQYIPTIVVNDGSLGRPLTAAGHEYVHALGMYHADTVLTDPVTNHKCGGNVYPQIGEPWPPDNAGRLQGVAFEARHTLATTTVETRVDTDAHPLFDLMSYCPDNDSEAWLSARNWNHAFANLSAYAARGLGRRPVPQTHAAQAGQGFVLGTATPNGGAHIFRIVPPDPDNLVPEPVPSSLVQVRALDAGGAVISETGAEVQALHGAPGALTFAAAVPPGAATVETVVGGSVQDRRERSHPPTVRLLAPLKGARVRGSLVARWTAQDPDGGTLDATVEYRAGAKAEWRTVFQGPDSGSAAIPGGFLSGSSRGQVKVTVSDGFDKAEVVSDTFRADGAAPTVAITRPDVTDDAQAGAVQLEGTAFDDRGNALRGRSLTWFAGARRLGTGERRNAVLRGGRVRLRLRAEDSLGRRTVATRTITVTPKVLELRVLRTPEHVRAGARNATVKIATTVPATLRAGGRAYRVGPRAGTVRIALPRKPARGVLRIPLKVTANGARQPPVREAFFVLRI